MPDSFSLGTVTSPSGVLVILDLAYMYLWSGTAAPVPFFDGTEDAETRALMLSAWDYAITGRDADRVATIANFIGFRFLYDWPEDWVKDAVTKVRDIAAQHGLDARVEREPARIPHRVRAQRAADLGGAYFLMAGPWVVAIGGIPARPLTVTGERHGLALIGDADSLGEWRHPKHRDEIFAQIEQSELGVGSLRLGKATLLGMSNSWGDGLFPVFADRDVDGGLLAVRLQLGDEKRRVLAEQVWARASKG